MGAIGATKFLLRHSSCLLVRWQVETLTRTINLNSRQDFPLQDHHHRTWWHPCKLCSYRSLNNQMQVFKLTGSKLRTILKSYIVCTQNVLEMSSRQSITWTKAFVRTKTVVTFWVTGKTMTCLIRTAMYNGVKFQTLDSWLITGMERPHRKYKNWV